MISKSSTKLNHSMKAIKFLGILLLSTNLAAASQTWPPAANPVVATQTFNAGQSATIAPGTTVVTGGATGLDFNNGSSLVFQANGTNFGTIDSTAGGFVNLFTGSQVILDVVGTPPPDGYYTLISGYMGVQTLPISISIQNGNGASVSIPNNPQLGVVGGRLVIQITGSTGGSVSDIVVTNLDGTTSTLFSQNIKNFIPLPSCSSGSEDTAASSFNFNTPQSIIKDMHRFVAGSSNFQSRFMPISPLAGTGARQIDMMKVLNEGQLPKTQFNLNALGTRVWMTGVYNYAINNLDRKHYTADSRGFQIGIDSLKTRVPFGLSFGYIATKPRVNHLRAGLNRTSQIGLYGGYPFGNLLVFASASYGYSHSKLQSVGSRQHFSTNSFGLSGMASYTYYITRKNILEPVIGLNYGHTWIPQISSFNNIGLINKSRAKENDNVGSEMGLRFSHFLNLEDKNSTPIKLFAQAMWNHNYKSNQKPSQVQLIGGRIVSNSVGQRQPNNTANLSLGAVVRKCDLDLSIAAGGSFARKVRSFSGMIGVRVPL